MDIKKRLKNLLEPGDSISQRVMRSGFWAAFFRIAERALRFVRTIVLARLLAPSDFGLFGIACIGLEMLQIFTETGFHDALVQKKHNTEEYLDAAWTIEVLRGSALSLLLFFAATPIAHFFNNIQAAGLTRLIALNTFIFGFVNIGIVYFRKEIDFRKYRLLSFARIFAEFLSAVILAFILRNAWSLAWSKVVGALFHCIISYKIHPYRPRFRLELHKARELFGFGKWIFVSAILSFLITQGDDIFVGKVLGTTALGFYAMAYAISNLGSTEIVSLLRQIMFPAFAKVQDNIKKLGSSYLSVIKIVAFFTLPLSGMVLVLGADFTRHILGEKWLPMIGALQILALWGAGKTLAATTGSIFLATGRPDLETKLQVSTLVLLMALIYPLTRQWGIAGTSLAVLFSFLPINCIAAYLAVRITKCGGNNFCKVMAIPFMNTALSCFVVGMLKANLFPVTGLAGFAVFAMLYGALYLGLTLLSDRLLNFRMYSLLQANLQKI